MEPAPSSHNAAGRRQSSSDEEAIQAEHPAPLPRKNRDKTVRSHTYDLRQTLGSRAGHTRSIYESRGRALTHDDGYLFGRDKPSHARADNHRRTPSELRRDAARYRGAAHPLCFTDKVMDHCHSPRICLPLVPLKHPCIMLIFQLKLKWG